MAHLSEQFVNVIMRFRLAKVIHYANHATNGRWLAIAAFWYIAL